ncbi:acetoacetyl-CoA synthetase [Caerostris darwini]|uniref:Acetoacetyl-CoA synthetase n=1 Tax=Caerostris darwini TaxID=1538125 RepID=A0AAV4RJI8_9ARAC|nr:acetoacetyl-CoA synthetase [Caerostris darwini]
MNAVMVIDISIPIAEVSPTWFKGAKLNFAENLLKYRDDKVAFIIAGENGKVEKLTFYQVFKKAELYASAFRKFGLKKGDVVVCQMSNRIEAMIGMIAVTSIGAIWSGALPLIGSKAVINRFKQVEAKVFLTIDQIVHQQKQIDMLPKILEIAEGLPTLKKIIIVPSTQESRFKDISDIKNSCFLDDFLQLGSEADGSVPPMQFEQVTFDHPVFINYTSGTTGLPKAIVHGLGFLLPVFRDFVLHFDTGRDSVWLSSSPVGWVSWNCFAGLLFVGCTSVLLEGSPYFLSPTYFWDMLDEYEITHIFMATSIVDELQRLGYVPKENSLRSLKVFMAGGSVVKPQNYDFVYEKVKKEVAFTSGFGCTEFMASCFVFDTTLAIYKGEINARSLGVAVEIVDEDGKPLHGETGEIVITKPMPNLPLGLWGDENNFEFHKKYYSKYPGKYTMNDCGRINPFTKGLVVCGRSDETLKQRGWRFGSSEIYNIVDTFPEVRDCLCVPQYNRNMEERAVLFLKMRPNYSFNENLTNNIREAITRELTANHVPEVILEIQDIPYSVNGKKLEITVKKVINKLPYSTETISNPESLEYYKNIPEF